MKYSLALLGCLICASTASAQCANGTCQMSFQIQPAQYSQQYAPAPWQFAPQPTYFSVPQPVIIESRQRFARPLVNVEVNRQPGRFSGAICQCGCGGFARR